jgi:disulfide oxidoreductase YuzD
MEIILAALAAGAAAAAKDTAGTAVKDAYEGLKALIKKKFAEKGKTDDSDIVDKHEKKPDSEGVKTLLKEELLEAKIDRDAEVIKTAEELLKQLKPEEFGSSRLCVIIFAYRIVKCLLGKTFRTILLKKLSV